MRWIVLCVGAYMWLVLGYMVGKPAVHSHDDITDLANRIVAALVFILAIVLPIVAMEAQ